MKAAVLHGNEDLRYEEFPTPETLPGTVKVHVRATGICGSDVPRVLHHGAHFYPVVLGHEFAGDVVEIGEGVEGFQAGDTVSGAPLLPCMKCADCQQGNFSLCKHYSFIGSRQQGSFADYVVMPAQNAVKYDPSIPYEQAAMFEPSTVALHGVFCNGYQGRRVVVFDIDEGRLALARRMGADVTINTKEEGFMARAKELTGGRGFDYVFEAAGNPVTMHMAFEAAANKAHVCFIGTPHVDMSFTPAEWENMNRKEFRLTGSWMSYSAPFPGREWELTAHYFATGQLKFDPEFLFKKFPMSQAAEAFSLFHHPEQVHGKIMLIND